MKKHIQFSVLLTLLSSMLVSFSVSAATEELKGKAPNFTLKSRSGKNIKLSELRGNVVMVNFWASWCGPCREEMPLLDQMAKKYERLGFTLLGVNVEQDNGSAKKYLSEVPVSFQILFDSTNQVSKLYNVSAMPSTVLIDRNGNQRYLHKGYKTGDINKYKKLVKQLIRE